MKRKKQEEPKLTPEQLAAKEAIEKGEKEIEELAGQLKKKQDELAQLRRAHIMEQVTQFSFDKAELDAFVAAFKDNPHVSEIATALINAAGANKVDMGRFQVKLCRLGIL